MSYDYIERALFARLKLLTPAWRLKVPGSDLDTDGQPFKIVATQPYMTTAFLPARPENAGFGFGKFSRIPGIFQIDVFYPTAEKSQTMLNTRVDQVVNWFYPVNGRGLELTYSGQRVLIDNLPEVSQLDEGQVHLRKSVSVRFLADAFPA